MSNNDQEKRMTILQVLPALESGGVERGTLEIAGALVKAGHRALVASSGGRMVAELEALGAEHITLPLKSKNPLKIFANVGELSKIIRAQKVDLIHARSRAPAWSAYYASRRTGIPFLTTFHGAYKFDNGAKKFYNSIMARGDYVIAISEYIRDHILHNYPVDLGHIVLIHRGFDPSRFDPAKVTPERQAELRKAWNLPEGVPVIMCPGRVSPIKGIDVLIKALAQIKDLPFACVIAGGDQGRESVTADLKALAEQLGVADRMIFTGHLNIDGAVLSLADITVSPAVQPEAFGRVLGEVQAMEKLIITSNAGGAPETLIEGQTGWLVPPGDEDELARALREFFALSPNERRSRERFASQHVREKFDSALMCSKTLEVYEMMTAT